jgi:hypothetical protein
MKEEEESSARMRLGGVGHSPSGYDERGLLEARPRRVDSPWPAAATAGFDAGAAWRQVEKEIARLDLQRRPTYDKAAKVRRARAAFPGRIT